MSLFKSSSNSFTGMSIASLTSHNGSFELVYDFNGIIANVVSQNKSKVEIQFSDNGLSIMKTVDISDDNHCHVEAHYFRVRITNLGQTTETFDCHTYLSLNAINTSSVAMQASQSQQLWSINEKLAGTLIVAMENQSSGNQITGGSTEATLLQVKNFAEIQSATLTSGLGSIDTRLQGWESAVTSIATTSQATAGRLPASIGQKTTTQSLSVCLSSDASALKVKTDQFGSFGNVASNATIDVSGVSPSFDISQYAYMYGFYEDSSTASSASVSIEFSFDGITFFSSGSTSYPYVQGSDGKRRVQIYRQDVAGINYVRIRNVSTSDSLSGVTITILGASMG